MRTLQSVLARTLFCVLCVSNAPGQNVRQQSSVADGTGGRSGNGPWTNLCASAQPGGIAFTTNGNCANYAGFLGTFSLRPELDSDGDGAHDEVDSDNDNDGLQDIDELRGTAFSPSTATDPNVSDSDADGMSDFDESLAGTHPLDSSICLRITNITCDAATDTLAVTWQARAGRTYRVYGGDDLGNGVTQFVGQSQPSGGTAPWFVVYPTLTTGSAGLTNYFFNVHVVP